MRRMGASRQATGRLAGFIRGVQQSGIQTALRQIGLGDFVGKPADDVLNALTDVVCPVGGRFDEAIARDAFCEAVAQLAEQGQADAQNLTLAEWQSLFCDFITRTIEGRVMADVGANGISLPDDVRAIQQLQDGLHGLIEGSVRDAFASQVGGFDRIVETEMRETIDRVYEAAFEYLEDITEEE